MRSPAALIALLILGLSPLLDWPAAARAEVAETRRTFRDWQAVCSPEGDCSASTQAAGTDATGQAGYQLRLGQRETGSDAGAGYQIALLARDRPPEVSGLMLQIDDETPLRLIPGSGYSAGPAGPVITDPETVRGLIRQMRAGGRLTVGFNAAPGAEAGQARQVAFSLWGISAALDFIESRSRWLPSAAAAAPGDWSVHLADFLPAMRRCLVATPGGPALVNKAWPLNRGMVGVRTLGADGRRWDCVAERIGDDIAMFEPVPGDAGSLPGEGAPLFTPPGQPPPQPSCYRHERARDAGGSFVGWLYYPGC